MPWLGSFFFLKRRVSTLIHNFSEDFQVIILVGRRMEGGNAMGKMKCVFFPTTKTEST